MAPIASPARFILAIAAAISVGACAASGPAATAGAPAATAGAPAATFGSSPAASPDGRSAETMAPASSDAWLVVGRAGDPGLEVILASTREELYALPNGVPGERWGTIVTTATRDGETAVEHVTVQPDLPARSRAVEGAWALPTIGYDPLPVGVSADGSTVVLVEPDPAAQPAVSRFAIATDGQPTRILELRGAFAFDAISPDGTILYVVEHLPAPPDGHYQVRAVDAVTGVMSDTVIVDKRNVDEVMGGWPITQSRHGNGVVFTLYRGPVHPFIHALNTTEAWAICLDLPEIGADDAAAALDWGLAMSGDGRALYAVNATLGLAAAIDPGELTIRRTTAFDAPRAAAGVVLAKFGHQDGGAVGRRAVVSPDGATLYAAGAGGIVRVATDRLTAAEPLLEGVAVEALALTPDGASLYALLATDGRIVRIDTATGQIVGEVPGDGYDRLVAVVPW
jgi:hypothetical protein